MRKDHRAQFDRFTRVRDFGISHLTHFPEDSRGYALFTQMNELVGRLETLDADRQSERKAASGRTENKAALRTELWEFLRSMNRSAVAMSEETPGLARSFTLPNSRNEHDLLAAARQFLKDARPLAARFIADEMPADFLTELEQLIEAFSEKRSGKMNSRTSLRVATEETAALVTRGINLVRHLDALVRNKFRGNTETLSRWQSTIRHDRVTVRGAASAEEEETGKSEE